MRVIADDIREAALSAGRHIAVAVEIAAKSDGEYITKQILSDTSGLEYVKITVGGDSDGVTIGKTYCAKLVIKIPRYIDIAEKDRLIVRVGYHTGAETSTGKIPLGWFYVDNITINGCVATVTAFDKMVRGSKNYISTLDYPAVLPNVLDEVCSQMGLALDSSVTVPEYTINTPPIRGTDNDGNKLYYTKRQMLGFIGSLMGGNWFIEAGSHLSLTRLSDSVDDILAANVTESDINADIFTVTGISWNTGNQTYRRQDVDVRGVIEFFNPLDVQREPILAALEMALVGKSYYGGKIKRQGAGWHEIGDVVNVPLDKSGATRPILLTGIERVIQNGGYTEAWQSCAQTESEANYTIDSRDTSDSDGTVQGDVYAVKTRESATSTEHNEYWDVGELRAYMVPGGYASGISTVLKNNEPKGDIWFGELGQVTISTGGNNQSFTGKFKVDFQDLGSTTTSVGYKISLYNSKNGVDSGLIIKLANGKLEVGSNDIKICVDTDFTHTGQLTFTIGGKKYKVQAVEIT